MSFFYKNRAVILLCSAVIIITVMAGFTSIEPEQQESPALILADTPLPELENTEEIAEEAAWETETTENIERETEAAEESAPEPETAEDVTQEEEVEESEESAEVTDESDFSPYDIPLSAELQQYTFDLCEERGLDFETVLALMYAESGYRPDVISRTDDYGLMQINRVNHGWLKAELGITDFLDAEQSIDAGTFMLMNISEEYPDTHQMLMVYNMGEVGARRCWNDGIYSSKYSRKIVAQADELKNSG